jgi:acyl-CoA reductase-like NAD-dependent aldehyde dehydrogenase
MQDTPLIARNPANDRVIATYPLPDAAQVTACMAAARRAVTAAAVTSLPGRCALLRSLCALIAERSDDIVDCIVATTGKTRLDALAAEVFAALEYIRYTARNAPRFLEEQRVPASFFFNRSSGSVIYQPRGVVAVIAPWNYPFYLSLAPVVSAIAAGNAVILKPSEYTLPVGTALAELCAAAGFPPNLLQVLPGTAETARQIIAAQPDMVFFTGGTRAGKEVMAACTERLTPCILELGAKDPMIVCDDAPFARAVEAAVYGAFMNAGQTCVAVERLYVHAAIYPRFLHAVTERVRALRVGPDGDLAAVTTPEQRRVIEEHVTDALQQGAVAVTQFSHNGPYYAPVILTQVHDGMRVLQEQTFGPVLPVIPFTTDEEAVRLANTGRFGLNASVWSSTPARARRIAAQLVTGSCVINDVIVNIAHPGLPFGGQKESGWGAYHGREGLRAFCRQTSLTVNRGTRQREVNWFPYTVRTYVLLRQFLVLRFTRGVWRKKIRALVEIIRQARNTDRTEGTP